VVSYCEAQRNFENSKLSSDFRKLDDHFDVVGFPF
jgi:hypothetical protein